MRHPDLAFGDERAGGVGGAALDEGVARSEPEPRVADPGNLGPI
jgi:hypothetical protein